MISEVLVDLAKAKSVFQQRTVKAILEQQPIGSNEASK